MSATVLPLPPTPAIPASETMSEASPLQPATLIAVTDPALFERQFAERLGVDVFVVSSAEAAVDLLPQYAWTDIYADYRQLVGDYRGAKWSGQTLLREVRSRPALRDTRFYILMEQDWQEHQRSWVVDKLGATGMLKRSPGVVARSMVGPLAVPAPKAQGNDGLTNADGIDQQFRRFSGPLGELVIKAVRREIEAGIVAATHDAYIEALAARLTVGDHAASFRRAVSQRARHEPSAENPVTSQFDPWMEAVNTLYTTFAGALGARVVVNQALAKVAAEPSQTTRAQYVELLAAALANPARRADFLAALQQKKL